MIKRKTSVCPAGSVIMVLMVLTVLSIPHGSFAGDPKDLFGDVVSLSVAQRTITIEVREAAGVERMTMTVSGTATIRKGGRLVGLDQIDVGDLVGVYYREINGQKIAEAIVVHSRKT